MQAATERAKVGAGHWERDWVNGPLTGCTISHRRQPMFATIKFQVWDPAKAAANPKFLLHRGIIHGVLPRRRQSHLRFPALRFSSISLQSEDAAAAATFPAPPTFTSSVASPPSLYLTNWNLTHRHIFILNVIACVAAVSASWLFFSAIPTLLAFKRAAESLEKLLEVTREELPDTMAAVRLSGMEISDLTMELSDLGQGITQGVRSSTRAVRMAEDSLRRMTTMGPTGADQSKNPEGGTSVS